MRVRFGWGMYIAALIIILPEICSAQSLLDNLTAESGAWNNNDTSKNIEFKSNFNVELSNKGVGRYTTNVSAYGSNLVIFTKQWSCYYYVTVLSDKKHSNWELKNDDAECPSGQFALISQPSSGGILRTCVDSSTTARVAFLFPNGSVQGWWPAGSCLDYRFRQAAPKLFAVVLMRNNATGYYYTPYNAPTNERRVDVCVNTFYQGDAQVSHVTNTVRFDDKSACPVTPNIMRPDYEWRAGVNIIEVDSLAVIDVNRLPNIISSSVLPQ